MLVFFVIVIISVVYFTKLHPVLVHVKAVSIIYYVLLTRYVFNANN
jgi:hypothetical protein